VEGYKTAEILRFVLQWITHLHLVPRSKNAWSCTSTPQCAFMAWCSVKKKAQGQLYLLPFTFIYNGYVNLIVTEPQIKICDNCRKLLKEKTTDFVMD
jgi:hypothetical protein